MVVVVVVVVVVEVVVVAIAPTVNGVDGPSMREFMVGNLQKM